MAAPSGTIEAYGRPYPKGTMRFAIELDCYRDRLSRADGGLGAEGHFKNAWKIFWPEFQWNDWCELMVWAWCNYKYVVIIGHARASKTYTNAHIAYLDYCADPVTTLTSVATVTFEGLRLRMWSDLLRAVETSRVPNPFTVRSTTNECRIFPTELAREAGEKYQIHGMSVSRTQDAPGRIRGGHADRRRIFLDEAQDMPDAIYETISNPMSAPDARCVMLTNPVEKISRFGEWCEPKEGWGSVDETDLWWETKKGDGQGVCLHFDGRQSPNLKAGRTIFPFLLTEDFCREVESNHGRESLQYWSQVIGFFPPDGVVSKIFPASVVERAKSPIRFDFAPQMCATLDPAFEQDDCVMHFGQLGMPVFGQRDYRINATETVVCKIDAGPAAEPKDYQVAHWVISECGKRGVQPKHFIMDRTGGGRGVYAILQKEWSRDVEGIDYGGAATDRMLRGDDSRKCNTIYKWFVTELWFRASECAKAGLLGGVSNLHPRTADDLSSRRYELKQDTKGTLIVAESKGRVKERLGRSPDFGDAFVQFGELLVRLGTAPGGGIVARMKAGSLWTRSKDRAAKAAARYDEAREFSY
jgi:hypothetical protein